MLLKCKFEVAKSKVETNWIRLNEVGRENRVRKQEILKLSNEKTKLSNFPKPKELNYHPALPTSRLLRDNRYPARSIYKQYRLR